VELALLSNLDIVKFIDVSGLFPAFIIAVLTYISIRLIKKFLDRFAESNTRYCLLSKQISVFVQFIILFIGGFFAASKLLAVSQDGMSLFIGLTAFGLSWASKDLFASLMAGLTLLIDRPFQVGDRITFEGHYGEVVEIGLRSVRVVDLDDNLISIPNNQFLGSVVSCANAGNLDQMCVFQFFIGCNEDFFVAERVIRESVVASRYMFWKKPVVVHMKEGAVPDGAERFAIILTAKAYVMDNRYESAFASDVHRRVKRAFKRHGIRTAGEIEWR
jgi:small-conductance mechanosensitive channel